MLSRKIALVTGAGSGIGRAVALRLARDGATVVVADLNAEAARATVEDVRRSGGDALDLRVDVRDPAQLQPMVDAVVGKYGRIDILVPCAGVVQVKRMLDISPPDWDFIFDVNARGLFFTLQVVARQMVRQRGGTIVNIASAAGRGPRATMSHYAASKAAVISLTWSAAADLAPHGITVNAVCPGVVETPMWDEIDRQAQEELGVPLGDMRRGRLKDIPLGRLETAEDVANAVAFLASPDASYITGQALGVDGGFQMH